MTPAHMKQWVLRGRTGFDSLQLEDTSVPETGECEVLVKIIAVSLNFRDLMVAKVSKSSALL